MAGRPILNGLHWRLLALLAAVLVAHALTLEWFAQKLQNPSLLRKLTPPMYTRLLQPQAPAAAPPVAARPAPQRAARAAPKAQAPASAASATAEAVEAAAAASTPASAPPPVAQAGPEAPATPQEGPASAMASAAASSAASSPANAPPAVAVASAPSAAASSPANALATWPADTRVNYRLTGYFRGDVYGRARVLWQREGGSYQAKVDIDLTLVSVVLTSQGDITPQGLSPRVYEEAQINRVRGVRIGKDTVTLHDGRAVPRPDGVQDTASQFVELSHRFATGQEPLAVGHAVSFWMARPGGLDLWVYDIVEREMLQTPELGAIEAFHLKPRPLVNPRGNITAEIWFAPSLQYLPVRIRVRMGSEAHLDLTVQNIEQR